MLARLAVLPEGHPAAALFRLVSCSTAQTWVFQAREWLSNLLAPAVLPTILQVFGSDSDAIKEARASGEARRRILRRYRHHVVRPLLQQLDLQHYQLAASRELPGLGVSPATLQPVLRGLSWDDFTQHSLPITWKAYRCWAIIRCFGRWPCPLFGTNDLPITLQQCIGCPQHDVTVEHALIFCQGSQGLRDKLSCAASIMDLFADTATLERRNESMHFVCNVCHMFLSTTNNAQ